MGGTGYQPVLVGNLPTRHGQAPCRDEEMRSEKLDVVLPPGRLPVPPNACEIFGLEVGSWVASCTANSSRRLVAQNCILLYRRVALCEASGKAHVWDRSDGLPNKIRRYGRLKICATERESLQSMRWHAFSSGRNTMPKKKTAEQEHKEYHKDGSLWAKGNISDGVPVGYWEWFRKDGTRLRSGHFEKGEQIGEWITYDKNGDVYKVTNIKPKTKKKA